MSTVVQYKCEACGASLNTREELMQHGKTHSKNVAQYKCAACGTSFASQAELTEHGKMHQKGHSH